MFKDTRVMLAALLFVALLMFGVAYMFVPLYRVFCQAFGIPIPAVLVGETAKTSTPHQIVNDNRVITVRFMSNQANGSPVLLSPTQRVAKIKIGEPFLTAYTAQNLTDKTFKGTAVHTLFAMGGTDGADVTPYVDLQQCFCFTEQIYPPKNVNDGRVNLPLSFTITPDLPKDIHTVTFAYTLFETVE